MFSLEPIGVMAPAEERGSTRRLAVERCREANEILECRRDIGSAIFGHRDGYETMQLERGVVGAPFARKRIRNVGRCRKVELSNAIALVQLDEPGPVHPGSQ